MLTISDKYGVVSKVIYNMININRLDTVKKKILWISGIVLGAILLFYAWQKFASTTRVGLINFQSYQTASMVKANEDKFVKYEVIDVKDLDKIKDYDFVMAFGMGLKITEAQREQMNQAAEDGLPIYVYAATNPENKICSLDSVTLAGFAPYMENGNKHNYRNMGRYIRKYIDRKTFFVEEPDSAVQNVSDVLFHLDEEAYFNTVAEYEQYLKSHHYYKEGGAKIAIVGGLNDPFSGNRANIDSLITSLQNAGDNVYPIYSYRKRLEFLQEISPDAVIHFAHGRMVGSRGEEVIDWLKQRNIPVFSPLSILDTQENWEKDPMGMMGGFLSQSVVVPELDGSIYPYVIYDQVIDEDGVYLFRAIPERLKNFTQIVNNFVNLKRKPNSEKKVAIYYFKGPGNSSLAAQGLETVPALYNVVKRLKAEGYTVKNLPATEKEFEKLIMSQGRVLNSYAKGSFDEFLKNGRPALVEKSEYEHWAELSLPERLRADVEELYGPAPGEYMSVQNNGKSYLAVARIDLGNIALLPQPMSALGDDHFAIVHGAKVAPPYPYIGAYLWAQHGFKADAMMHFGTHGSLEFTPQKQVALCQNDWPDRLVGNIPHFYMYTIGNVGECIIAKRRSYATSISYLTPAFMETNMRGSFKELMHQIEHYYHETGDKQKQASLKVKQIAVQMGLHRDLRLDSVLTKPYTEEEIGRIENFAEEISNEKMNGELYTSGVPYTPEKIRSTVMAMSADPIAYSLSALDRERGQVTDKELKNQVYFTKRYLNPAKALVNDVLDGRKVADGRLVSYVARVSEGELAQAHKILTPPDRRMMMMMAGKSGKNGKNGKPAHHGAMSKSATKGGHMGKGMAGPHVTYSNKEKIHAQLLVEVERTILNIKNYQRALQESPELEMRSILNALNGGYIAPSSGGDPVGNPQSVPTGRNLFSVNAESTPSEQAWHKGVELVNNTIAQYKKTHGQYPRKVSYTFWSSEFIESEGATLAQVLYMLGVEPVRDAFGRVSDIRLIPSEVLGRPRIDVVVQTSGQFRDLAASRLLLISRAVEMAAAADDDKFPNQVKESVVETERLLVEQGMSPNEARKISSKRVFGGVNGMYGTNIQGMITSGDKWENEKEIADTYIQNMGAIYGDEENWGEMKAGLLRAALHNTDAVVQPRQNNTWGALSLDHVYEFMGGMNLAVRSVTGKDPEAYFADYRNRNRVKMQEIKEAIGVESRATIFNPEYIKEVMKGGASSASQITDVVTNTYGWNVTKPKAIDQSIWNRIYDVYVEDSYKLGTEQFFKTKNPAALQEITAVMMETARKGMWKATDHQLNTLAKLHTDLVREFGSSGSGMSAGNAKLQDFISKRVDEKTGAQYKKNLTEMKTAGEAADKDGMVLKKEEMAEQQSSKNVLNGIVIAAVVFVAFIAMLFVMRRKRKNN